MQVQPASVSPPFFLSLLHINLTIQMIGIIWGEALSPFQHPISVNCCAPYLGLAQLGRFPSRMLKPKIIKTFENVHHKLNYNRNYYFGTLLIYQSFWEYTQEVINVKQLINLGMQPTGTLSVDLPISKMKNESPNRFNKKWFFTLNMYIYKLCGLVVLHLEKHNF